MDAVAQMKETEIQAILFPSGGFVTGERTLPAPVDLGYGNLGLYFAKRGFVAVIPDYRLAPITIFPGPVEDIQLGPDADVNSVFFLGHSAGGVHTLTLLLHPPDVLPNRPIKGAVIASAPFYSAPESIDPPTFMYYTSPELSAAHEPLALLRAAPPELIAKLPPLAFVKCEHDPAWFKVIAKYFDAVVAEKGIKPAPAQMMAEGQNHISFSWTLETGTRRRRIHRRSVRAMHSSCHRMMGFVATLSAP
ncbi:Alpha/Beta hydrolase protein [Mycena vulgaris]|nr:Alpha/Beta hydrolase protein [Mycena vulgaris]